MKSILFFAAIFILGQHIGWAQAQYTDAGNGNPLVPGYFADPTIKKFGDTYYLYATTDGIKLASGEPQVWISKDFVNWYDYEMDVPLPKNLTNCWAPDVVQGSDGKYYYFQGNCEAGCNIYGYVSDSPMGPWASLNGGKAVIPVGTGVKDLPALDAQYLVDDDGSIYAYFGTWITSFSGMGWAKINPADHYSILSSGSIPIAQIPKAFEAAYPMKRNGKYILMYSSGDCRLSTYTVSYSYGNSPIGPFTPGANCPILQTNPDKTIDSPGHHSVLKEGDNYYMVYHRHDNPHSSGGEFRQVCANPMIFANDSTILPIKENHEGIGYLATNQIPYTDLAYKSKASATSYYHLVAASTKFTNGATDYKYLPEYATDNNNGTMWKAGTNLLPQSLVIDLGKTLEIRRVMTQFEYPTFYYQYKIECSADSASWTSFSDKTTNRRSGCPMIDDGSASARYVRITVTGTEKAGLFAAIWNVKIYDTLFDVPAYQNKEVAAGPVSLGKGNLLMNLDASACDYGTMTTNPANTGSLGGSFARGGTCAVAWLDSVKSIKFNGSCFLKLSVTAPQSLSWNSPYTASCWVNNPKIGAGECLMTWDSRDNMLQGSYTALMYGTGNYGAVAHGDGYVDLAYGKVPVAAKWHHIAVTFDGMLETVYVDGVINSQAPINLFVASSSILIGQSGNSVENFTGYMANAQLFDKTLTATEIAELMKSTAPPKVADPNSTAVVDTQKKESNKLKVSYQPGNSNILVSSTEDTSGKVINLVGMDGRLVSSGKFNSSSNIELPVQDKGVYILVMKSSTGTYSQKLAIY